MVASAIGLTLEKAREKYWKFAEAAECVALNKSYKIDGDEYVREDLGQIQKMMAYWEGKCRELSGEGVGRSVSLTPVNL